MHIDEVSQRASNARLAGFGAAGICALNMYRVSQEIGYVSSSTKIMCQSGLFGLVAGLIWFFMPRALTDSGEDTSTQTKTVLKEPIQVLIKRTLAEHRESMQELKAKYSKTSTTGSTSRSYSYSVTPSSTTTTTTTVSSTAVVVRKFQDPWEKEFSKTPVPIVDEFIDDSPEDGEDDYEEISRRMLEEALLEDELEQYEALLEEDDPFEEVVDDDEYE